MYTTIYMYSRDIYMYIIYTLIYKLLRCAHCLYGSTRHTRIHVQCMNQPTHTAMKYATIYTAVLYGREDIICV